VAANVDVGNLLFDFRHVTAYALVPALPARWWVCASMMAPRGPFGEFGPWHSKHVTLAGFNKAALSSVPWTS
jgi:hypothetical protein